MVAQTTKFTRYCRQSIRDCIGYAYAWASWRELNISWQLVNVPPTSAGHHTITWSVPLWCYFTKESESQFSPFQETRTVRVHFSAEVLCQEVWPDLILEKQSCHRVQRQGHRATGCYLGAISPRLSARNGTPPMRCSRLWRKHRSGGACPIRDLSGAVGKWDVREDLWWARVYEYICLSDGWGELLLEAEAAEYSLILLSYICIRLLDI